jgi:hypothetical protein
LEGVKGIMVYDINRQTFNVTLEVNGKSIELNDFVNNFIASTVIGMVKPLRGVQQVQNIKIAVIKSDIVEKND